jgi:hypothetical protein
MKSWEYRRVKADKKHRRWGNHWGGSRKETGPPRISIRHVRGTRWNYHTAAGNKSTQPYTVTVDGETGLRAPRELYGGAETGEEASQEGNGQSGGIWWL